MSYTTNNAIEFIPGEKYDVSFLNGCGLWNKENALFYGVLSKNREHYEVFVRDFHGKKRFTIATPSLAGFGSCIGWGFKPLNWGQAETIEDAIHEMEKENTFKWQKSVPSPQSLGKYAELTE